MRITVSLARQWKPWDIERFGTELIPMRGYELNLATSIGLTTEVNIADLSSNNLLTLPRLDTNDLSLLQKGENKR